MTLTQQAFKDIDAAKAAAAQLLYQVGTANKWTAEQYKEAAADLDDVGSGGWGWLAAWSSLPWNPTSWAGLDDLAKLEAVQAYWEAVAELGADFEVRGLPGADKFRATANQAARTSGSEIEEYKAGRPEVVVVGGATGTAEDLAEVGEQGGDLLARYPWLPLAGLAGVVGLVLLVQRGGRTIVVRR
ncbi:hypothetical protein [Herbaspirillum sp.]|uniref:hypothetical protein n=1 Tax=Herbaspirillum sp. TaxID=1890675 RepID=UPI000C11BD8F|nr:hypothetical protein [Herbaspirillum sp.]MBO18903.1 hypothetical protein [Herbaspirillum sp.]